MIDLVDFNGAPRLNRFYGGDDGRKIAVEYEGCPWILKYPESTAGMHGRVASYTTSPVFEYLGSHVYASLGLPVYDNGNSFFNKRHNSINAVRLLDDSLVAQDSIGTLTSVYLRDGGHHVMPFRYIGSALDGDCNAALVRFAERLDMDAVLGLVGSLPTEVLNFTVVQPETKEFMKRMLVERFAEGFAPVLRKLGALGRKHDVWLATRASEVCNAKRRQPEHQLVKGKENPEL